MPFFPFRLRRFAHEKAVEAVTHQRAEEAQARWAAEIALKEAQFIEARSGQPQTRLTDFQSYIAAGTGQVWATFRACHLVGSTISSAAIHVESIASGEVVVPKTGGTDLASLIYQPNDYDSLEEMVYMWAHHMKLTGTAYWLKDEPNGKGQPKALYPLLPQFVKVVPDRKTRISRFEYTVNGESIIMPSDQVIHFRRPHPSTFLFGLGDIEGGTPLYESLINTSALETKFMANGAQPSGILTKKEEVGTPDDWVAFKKKFNAEYAGRANAGKVAFLNGDWSYLRLGLTSKEMEAIDKSKWTVEQIFANHGVPLSIAGIRDAANFATAKIDDQNFRRYECVPLLRLFIGKLNAKIGLSSSYGGKERVAFKLSGLIDVEQVVKECTPLVKLGAMSLNELRVQAGLPELPDPLLDQRFVDNNRIPLEMAGLVDGSGGGDGNTDPPQ